MNRRIRMAGIRGLLLRSRPDLPAWTPRPSPRRACPRVGRLPVLVLYLCFATDVTGGTGSARMTDSILGVKIGTSVEQARALLTRHGAGGGRNTREGGRKEAWTLEDSPFASVAFKTNRQGKVLWLTGFLRLGQEIPFTALGDPSRAVRLNESQAIWNVALPEGGYRLVAKGREGKAGVVYLISLAGGFP